MSPTSYQLLYPAIVFREFTGIRPIVNGVGMIRLMARSEFCAGEFLIERNSSCVGRHLWLWGGVGAGLVIRLWFCGVHRFPLTRGYARR